MVSLGRVAKLQVGVFHSALSCASIKATGAGGIYLRYSPGCGSSGVLTEQLSVVLERPRVYKHGRPVLAIPLPSRRERCLFSLRPMLMNVGDFIQDVRREDPGVTTTAVLSEDGEHLSSCTSVETLLRRDFRILINDVTYHVHCPAREGMPTEQLTNLEDLKAMVHTLHTALQLPRHHRLQERELLEKLDSLRQHLVPLEKVKSQVEQRAESMCSWGVWAGLAVLSLQGGVLAWFTWWVYSWDIMEPITYFLTYATSLGFLSYFILTKQEFAYAEAKDRKFLHYFYKAARRQGFDVNEYNKLKEEVAAVEDNLRRLRKQTQLQLPLEQIQTKP